MHSHTYSIGLIGAGYIADYHAKALRRMGSARLAAVCDASPVRATKFAAAHHIGGIYDSIETMLANEALDVVHVLTPPEHHASVGRMVLESGAHLFLEKPMCTEPADCDRLLEIAERQGLRVGANHNFLFHAAYEWLRSDVRSGVVGAIDHVAITWALELPQLRSGPFDMWAMQDPTNILLEIGSHCMSQVLDLGLMPDSVAVHPGSPMMLPGGRIFYCRWQVCLSCNHTAVDLYFSFTPGFARRTIEVSGNLGTACADLERNTYVLQRNGRRLADFGKYEIVRETGRSLKRQAREQLCSYLLSKLGWSQDGNAYAASIERSIRAFYEGLAGSMDARCSGQLGRQVIEQCCRLMAAADVQRPPVHRSARTQPASVRADALVLGGTGFIGRELVRQLLESGKTVRVLTRNRVVPLDTDHPHLQIVVGDVQNESDLVRAVQHVSGVYHLARAGGGSWKDYYEQDVMGTERVARACLNAEVGRLVYTSSIVGYSLAGSRPITEQTDFDPAILVQNKYARAKAQAEQILAEMHESKWLPVVIVRPGMVIGRGGDLCHGGVGTWNGLGSCIFWGDGRGKLPLVLVDDVARGLIAAMQTPDIEGHSFNLVDEPCLSAREYVEQIERFAGVAIQTFPTGTAGLLTADLAKWAVKLCLRMPERYVPRYRMWKGRMARACFDCSKAKTMLGWKPAGDRETLIVRGIHAHLIELSGFATPEAEDAMDVPTQRHAEHSRD